MILMTVESAPSQQLIDLSDEIMESFFKYSGVSQYRKLCFAVHELVINAVEATLKQQKLADIADEEPKISIRMELNGDDILITISNHGYVSDGQWVAGRREISLDVLLSEERGKGLLTAKRLSDQLIYEQDENGRITIQLRKKGGAHQGPNQLWTSL